MLPWEGTLLLQDRSSSPSVMCKLMPRHTHFRLSTAQAEIIPPAAFFYVNSSPTSPSPWSLSSSSYSELLFIEDFPCQALYSCTITLFNPISYYCCYPQLQMRKLRPRMLKWLTGSLTALRCQRLPTFPSPVSPGSHPSRESDSLYHVSPYMRACPPGQS